MGDYNAKVEIKVTYLDKIYEMDTNIDYCPDKDDVDYRIKSFFANCWYDMQSRRNEVVYKSQLKEDLAELKRLNFKYGLKIDFAKIEV